MDKYIHGLFVLVPVLYGIIAVTSFAPFLYIVAFIPKEEFFSHPGVIVWVVFPLVNALACIVISYSFFALRNWGRYVTITYNTVWITYLLFVVVMGIILGDFQVNGPTIALFLIILILIMITVFCLRQDVRKLMTPRLPMSG